MSRHRAVRNLDLDDELDDAAFSDEEQEEYPGITPDQQVQLASGLSSVQSVLGSGSGLTDKEIKDALWYYYFDQEKTISYLLDQQHKKSAAKEKAEADETEDAILAEETQSHLAIQDVPSTILQAPQPPAKRSLSALAAASRKPASGSTSSLSALAAAKAKASSSTTGKPNFSKLAAKSQASADSSARRSLSSLAAASRTEASHPKPADVEMEGVKAEESEPAAPTAKLSKLQQRIQRGGTHPAHQELEAAQQAKEEEEKTKKDVWQLPSSSLFPSTAHLNSAPSPFADTLVPEHPHPTGPEPAAITDQAVKAGLDKLPQLTSSVPQQKPLHKSAAGRTAQKKKAAASSKSTTPASSRPGTPTKSGFKSKPAPTSSLSKSTTLPSELATSRTTASTSQLSQDLRGLGLDDDDVYTPEDTSALPTISIAKEKLIEDIKRQETEADYKPVISMVVIGHVDAGKSTLMGRLLAELGEMSERLVNANQRQSEKMGKGSFAHAWALDARPEERERGVTIDIGIDSFSTPHRRFTLLDAPGHRDFIPNMISGASQADTALLVVDASTGAFESGFNEGGQTREHALLVRSFGVQQLVVAVNKLDAVDWSQHRFEYIVERLQPFLVQAGYNPSKLAFIPCGGMSGENLVERRSPTLKAWYEGKTIIETLDALAVPERALDAPLRIPVSNVFKGQTTGPSGLGASGRIESGVVQVGEKLAVLPGDETAIVKSIEIDGEPATYATAGSNVTLYLAAIDPLYVNVGCVLCEPEHKIPLASSFLAQIVTFELKFPLTMGSAVELFYHSKETPATVSKIEATLDKSSGEIIKHSPRMVSKGSSARIAIKLRPSASTGKVASVPLETFAANKNMGRILLRRGGETVAAGIVLKILE